MLVQGGCKTEHVFPAYLVLRIRCMYPFDKRLSYMTRDGVLEKGLKAQQLPVTKLVVH